MKLIGLLLVRNEEWILRACIDAASRWCDGLAIMQDRCTDNTYSIVGNMTRDGKDSRTFAPSGENWNEMDLRQSLLESGRALGGTHFAMIDADEMLTHNLLPHIRQWCEGLMPGDVLDLPMIVPHRGLDRYRDDMSVWSNRNDFSVAFADRPDLTWKPRDQGYQHHARCPQGAGVHVRPLSGPKDGGVFHLQWASWERLLNKHRAYKIMERIRWPNRESVQEVDRKYSQALDETGLRTRPIPAEWWGDYKKDQINLNHRPWYMDECERMAREHPEALEGLNLWGWP